MFESGGLLVRDLAAVRTSNAAIAIGRGEFRRPAMRAEIETQFARERRLGHAEVAFRLQKDAVDPGGHIPVRRQIFASDAKFVRNETD